MTGAYRNGAVLARIRRAFFAEAHARARRRPIRPRTVLYESFAGGGVVCNPEAIFRELTGDPGFAGWRHIWVLSSEERIAAARAEAPPGADVRFVVRGTKEYYAALATSSHLVNNATFPPEFSKRPGQVYLNTWHGTPLKTMGYDMPDGPRQSANTLRNFLHADYLLSSGPYMTEQMYFDAYRLREMLPGAIIEEGAPRVDRQLPEEQARREGREALERAGLSLTERVVLYAPTWKGAAFGRPVDDVAELVERARELRERLGEDVTVLLKTHQIVQRFVGSVPGIREILVPDTMPANIVLAASDALVTDYSSIFFDYLPLRRPVAFLAADMSAYDDTRGVYLPVSTWPGPVFDSVEKIAEVLAQPLCERRVAEEFRERHEEWIARYAPRDDGEAAQRVVDVVFRGIEHRHRVIRRQPSTRTSVLIHVGQVRPNGITSAALALLEHLDPERYDVRVQFGAAKRANRHAAQERIPQTALQLFRLGGMNGSKITHGLRHVEEFFAGCGVRVKLSPSRLWNEEWRRNYGGLATDRVIDFAGYNGFWAQLMASAPGGLKSIWMHNDMIAERDRVVRGERRFARPLRRVTALYPRYENVVSVSPALERVNRAGFEGVLDPRAITSARNLVDAGAVTRLSREPLLESIREQDRDSAWAASLAGGDDDTVWFVAVGRLSPEKNHERLLRAFAQVHAADPRTRLLIVGGGALEAELRLTISHLGLRDAAFLAGRQRNPFAIMAAADCVVISSDYEGQPMVILEAAILARPIVSVAFDSVDDALPDPTIHVVRRDEDGLAAGMRDFLRGEVEPSVLDGEAYNARALEEFERATGPRSARQAAQ